MAHAQNRNKVKMWFITFPHSGEYTPQSFITALFTLACIVGVAGCRETHSDGITPHIHINLHLKYGLTSSQLLGKIKRTFPDEYKRIDVRPTRQRPEKAKEEYLAKESTSVYSYSNNVELEKGKVKKMLREYNRASLDLNLYDNHLGIVNIEATTEKWNLNLTKRENFQCEYIVWVMKPKDPWYMGEEDQE